MEHTAIDLPLGNMNTDIFCPENIAVAEGEAAREVQPDSPEWLRVFGAPSPVAPDDPQPLSAHILEEVAALRARHHEKGHTPQSDAQHSDFHFINALEEFVRRARTAKRSETRRKNLITAIGVLTAMVDADDYRAAQATTGENHENAA